MRAGGTAKAFRAHRNAPAWAKTFKALVEAGPEGLHGPEIQFFLPDGAHAPKVIAKLEADHGCLIRRKEVRFEGHNCTLYILLNPPGSAGGSDSDASPRGAAAGRALITEELRDYTGPEVVVETRQAPAHLLAMPSTDKETAHR